MAMQVTRDQVQRTLGQAKKMLIEHKQMISEVVKGGEAFAAPLLVGLAEGRLAKDGSGHVQIAGVPLNLLLGVIGVGAGASGMIDDYGVHAANMGAGLLGAYGSDLGRELGLGMRLNAGKPVQMGVLNPVKEAEIRAKATAAGKALPALAPPAGVRIGWAGDTFTGEFAVGGAPGPLSAQALEDMVEAAAAANQ